MAEPAGYSGTPLVQKLGYKPGTRVRIINQPPHYLTLLGPLPDDIIHIRTSRGACDFIHLFAKNAAGLNRALSGAVRQLKSDGMLWISWPKKASSIQTDLGEAIVRETGLAAGLVDVKICAIDDDWSGLKFVYRLKDRPQTR